MNDLHISAQDAQSRLYHLTNALDDMAAGCDPEFDNAHDELEREFAELRFTSARTEREAAMKLTVIDIAHHRNGVAGAPFEVVLFKESGSRKVAILFEEQGHCAVLDVDKLAAGDIAFGSNSWRGDDYEPDLMDAITAFSQRKGR